MKKAVWKFPIEHDNYVIEMPKGAEILTCQNQNEIPCIWALVDPLAAKEKRYFEIYGTGHTIKLDGEQLKYIATIQLQDGGLVFHVFENISQ